MAFCAMHVHVNKRFTSCVWTSFIIKYFLPMELNITFFYKSKSLISLIFGWCLYHRHKPQPIHTRAVQTLDHDLKWGCMRTFELLHFKLFCPTARNDSVRSVCYTFGISSDLKFVNLALYCAWVITGPNFTKLNELLIWWIIIMIIFIAPYNRNITLRRFT